MGARIVLPVAYPHHEHIWNQYTLRILGEGRRDALKEFLWNGRLVVRFIIQSLMDQQKCFADTPEASRQGCGVAHRLAGEAISIPVYPELTEAQKAEVVSAIAEFLADGALA